MEKKGVVKTTIRMEEYLWKQLQIMLTLERTSFQEYCKNLITKDLENSKFKEKLEMIACADY